MKQIICMKSSPNGFVKVVIRIVGKYVFMKKNNDAVETRNLIKAYQSKGANVEIARNWIKIDFIKDNKTIMLGGKEIDLENTTKEDLEEFLYNFYLEQYKRGGFIIK